MKTSSKINEVVKLLQERFGSDYLVKSSIVIKNNGTFLTAIVISNLNENTLVSPSMYVPQKLEEDFSVEELADYIQIQYSKIPENGLSSFNANNLLDKNYILKNVVYSVINKERNKELLMETIHREFLDLAVIYKVIIPELDNLWTTVTLKEKLVMECGLSLSELDIAARKNTIEKYGVACIDLGDAALLDVEKFSQTEATIDKVQFSTGLEMYILSNHYCQNGSFLLLYEDILSELSEKAKCDLYIVPMSIHDLLLIPVNEAYELEFLKTVLRDVNQTVLEKEEFLSGNVYCYSHKDAKLRIA